MDCSMAVFVSVLTGPLIEASAEVVSCCDEEEGSGSEVGTLFLCRLDISTGVNVVASSCERGG